MGSIHILIQEEKRVMLRSGWKRITNIRTPSHSQALLPTIKLTTSPDTVTPLVSWHTRTLRTGKLVVVHLQSTLDPWILSNEIYRPTSSSLTQVRALLGVPLHEKA